MAKRGPISPGEWDVARAVWELGEATVGQAFDLVSRRKKIDYATVQTYLRRLETKGYLRTRREGRNNVYLPRVKKTQATREAVGELLNRVFDGEALALFEHLVDDRRITADETRELRDLLDRLEAEQAAGHQQRRRASGDE